MAMDRSAPLPVPLWSVRMVEWSLLAAVILVIALVFGRQVQVVQGQGELAAVKSTLGALRTALVLEHLQQNVMVHAQPVANTQRNPFELLDRPPANYLGEMSRAQAAFAPPGSWFFDRDCACVGYVPLDPRWLDSPSGSTVARYRLSGAPGPRQLVADEAYVWQDQVLD